MSPSPDNAATADSAVRRLLVVDDEPTLRLGFSYALANPSTVVDTASTGRQALEKIKAAHYDLVVLDLRMPDVDGFGVIEGLRHTGNLIPVVMCSAAITPAAAVRAIQHRVPDLLLKPVRPADLREVVDYVLSPPDTPVSRIVTALRSGKIDVALEHAKGEAGRSHGATVWVEVLEAILHPHDEDSPEGEKLIRTSLAALAFRSTGSPS